MGRRCRFKFRSVHFCTVCLAGNIATFDVSINQGTLTAISTLAGKPLRQLSAQQVCAADNDFSSQKNTESGTEKMSMSWSLPRPDSWQLATGVALTYRMRGHDSGINSSAGGWQSFPLYHANSFICPFSSRDRIFRLNLRNISQSICEVRNAEFNYKYTYFQNENKSCLIVGQLFNASQFVGSTRVFSINEHLLSLLTFGY